MAQWSISYIHLYIRPTSHPNHSLEHIRRWVPWRMTCHLCASWGLGCCFFAIPVSDTHMGTLESKFRYPMIFGYKLGWQHNRNSTARSKRFPKEFPHLQRHRHGPLDAILHVRGWALVVDCGNSYEFLWMARPQKKRSASDGSQAGHRSSLTRTPEKCTCERRNTVQTNIPYYGLSWSPINYIGSISLSHSKSLY